jgi:hypothetical protein
MVLPCRLLHVMFRSVGLSSINQDEMLAIRQGWFDECGAPPPGNKLALERKAWQVCDKEYSRVCARGGGGVKGGGTWFNECVTLPPGNKFVPKHKASQVSMGTVQGKA